MLSSAWMLLGMIGWRSFLIQLIVMGYYFFYWLFSKHIIDWSDLDSKRIRIFSIIFGPNTVLCRQKKTTFSKRLKAEKDSVIKIEQYARFTNLHCFCVRSILWDWKNRIVAGKFFLSVLCDGITTQAATLKYVNRLNYVRWPWSARQFVNDFKVEVDEGQHQIGPYDL